MDRAEEILKTVWGYDSFRPKQRQSIDQILARRDSLTVLPTGGGKSICYQVPALCFDDDLQSTGKPSNGERKSIAVVVSPLISLMKDQVDKLAQRGVAAACINSTQSEAEKRKVADQIRQGDLRLLYLAPEKLLSERTIDFLKQQSISFFAIDEAHCVSQWGHDFRTDYRALRKLKKRFPECGVHAFTATASPRVRQDIAVQLGLQNAETIVGDFDRPNLSYRFLKASRKTEQVFDVIERHPGECGIVYCISRKEVERTTHGLLRRGCNAIAYHAGMSDKDRHAHQSAFMKGQCDVIVATVAFGMGIDKPNVRFVIHAGMPKSIEHYQQESGRAGRDGLPSECVLLHSMADLKTWQAILQQCSNQAATESLEAIHSLCNGLTCRHRSLVEYFGQTFDKDDCGACDVCLGEIDLIDDAMVTGQKILSCVVRLKERFGIGHTADILAGSRTQRIEKLQHDQLSTFGLLADHGIAAIKHWTDQLILQGFLMRKGEYNTLSITETGRSLLRGEAQPRLSVPTKPNRSSRKRQPDPGSSIASFQYFRSGDSVDEVATKMDRARSTVVRYLTDYLRANQISDPSPWVDQQVAQKILDQKDIVAGGKLKPMFEHFNGDVSYDEIRITLACAAHEADAVTA